jgi:hypothetical protein
MKQQVSDRALFLGTYTLTSPSCEAAGPLGTTVTGHGAWLTT